MVLDVSGSKAAVTATGEGVFRNADDGVTASYFGRAGTVEGLSIQRPEQEPVRMRFAEDPIVGAADLPEFKEEPAGKALRDTKDPEQAEPSPMDPL